MSGDVARTDTRWHKGSRYWRVGTLALVLSYTLVILAVWKSPDSVEVAFGVFGGVATVLLGGGAASNWRERETRTNEQRGT